MIALYAAKALGFLKGIPWPVYAAVALVLAFWLYGNHQYAAGKQVVIERLEKAEAKAQADAIKAARSADVKQQKRAVEFEAQQETLEGIISDAQSDNTNALDGIFSSGSM